VVTQLASFSRKGVDRILKYAFELAKTRKKHVTSCTKSNGISITMPYWDERFAAMKKNYPGHPTDQYHVDGLHHPAGAQSRSGFDVVVASNLFGDILLRPRPGDRRHHRHRGLGQHQSRAHRAVDLRAGARLGAGHRRQGRSPTRSPPSGRVR
jgi:hypothetical protein